MAETATPVGILGASGYTGGELVRLLARHPRVIIDHVTSERYAGQPLTAAYPHLRAAGTLVCRPMAAAAAAAGRCPVVFCALPHLTSMKVIPDLLAAGCRVIDLSADYRLREAQNFATWYGKPHSSPDLLQEAVYGLPERHRGRIAAARLVANPGCYPTSVLLGIGPLLEAGLADPDLIVIDAKSGASGAGRAAQQGMLLSELHEGFKAYKVTGHRHIAEMEQELAGYAGRPVTIRFTPHLVPQVRGILSTCYLRPRQEVDLARWQGVLEERYAGEPFVTVLPPESLPATNEVRGSNGCVLALHQDVRTGWMVVLAVIDNLVKGAAGQAVQNLNLMMGWPETAGLDQLPLFP
ncbi:MAG: N-acetyl-gamma-glutamyl-phosphate reductase [Magnetococcales bacterium]|nr:N-acetyl-gamma-glutamyl-phosphate reductase [Magnetococcales bacterium]